MLDSSNAADRACLKWSPDWKIHINTTSRSISVDFCADSEVTASPRTRNCIEANNSTQNHQCKTLEQGQCRTAFHDLKQGNSYNLLIKPYCRCQSRQVDPSTVTVIAISAVALTAATSVIIFLCCWKRKFLENENLDNDAPEPDPDGDPEIAEGMLVPRRPNDVTASMLSLHGADPPQYCRGHKDSETFLKQPPSCSDGETLCKEPYEEDDGKSCETVMMSEFQPEATAKQMIGESVGPTAIDAVKDKSSTASGTLHGGTRLIIKHGILAESSPPHKDLPILADGDTVAGRALTAGISVPGRALSAGESMHRGALETKANVHRIPRTAATTVHGKALAVGTNTRGRALTAGASIKGKTLLAGTTAKDKTLSELNRMFTNTRIDECSLELNYATYINAHEEIRKYLQGTGPIYGKRFAGLYHNTVAHEAQEGHAPGHQRAPPFVPPQHHQRIEPDEHNMIAIPKDMLYTNT
ncbi:quinone oxidoreductase-like 2 [Plakobranchus ocellatus]|uniref:Quinone oxidoreductase-like 2 n=1 Tax=Plakobranchus ocellatus TaxID=259542 RepID=A0AAV4DKH7_9GAST|nr:quinone oxidoreductase-like 2 [Plakobranchus ocellatus]